MTLTRLLARWFPVPTLLVPRGAGVDVSDTSVKWLSLKARGAALGVAGFGAKQFAKGIVEMGAIKDAGALGEVLREVRNQGFRAAHAALPEEGAYVFSMHVPSHSSRSQIRNIIEFELENRVPIPLKQAVYDFDTINERGEHGEEVAVTVFPLELAEGYVEAFSRAKIDLLSLEIEARSIARAISGPHSPVSMLIDAGHARTGVAILKRGIPIFTSTVEIGGDTLTRAAMDALKLSNENEAEVFKNEHGLLRDAPQYAPGAEAVEKVALSLADEIARHYRFWDTRRGEESGALEKVYLLGGSANLRGLPEYIAGKVHVRTERPDVWRNVVSFDDYIPQIDYRSSFQYATAIGLALRSF